MKSSEKGSNLCEPEQSGKGRWRNGNFGPGDAEEDFIGHQEEEDFSGAT